MMMTPKFHEIFSPTIMETEVSQKFLDIVNKVGDNVLSDDKQSVQWDWSHKLVGKVHKEIRIPITSKEDGSYCMGIMKEACVNYLKFLIKKNRAYEWTRIAGKEKPPTSENIHLSQSWIVSQYKNEYNPWHTHSGNFSSVIYLKIPDNMEEHFANEKRDHYPASGLIDFKFGEKQDMRSDTFLFHPQLGKMLLFPSWLNHTVYPFYCDGERRSMSFNANFFIPKDWNKK
jgi:hypothetical protein